MNTSPRWTAKQPQFLPHLLGDLEMVTACDPTTLVSLAEAKLHLRVDQSVEDALLTMKIGAATRFCEENIEGSRQFLSQTFDLPVAHWWFEQGGFGALYGESGWARQSVANGRGEALAIPKPPLQSIASVKYYDVSGTLQTLDSSYYLVRTPYRQKGTIERAPLMTFPLCQPDRRYPITIRFVAGYGAASAVPTNLKCAVLIALGWLYEDRSPLKREMDACLDLLNTERFGGYG